MLKLNPITAIGLNTKDVESFTSLVIRSAARHMVSTSILLRFCFGSTASETDCKPAYDGISTAELVRPNATTAALLNAFSQCSGLDPEALNSMTFTGLGRSVHRCSQTFAKNVRWCPACFAERDREQLIPYLKLSWSLLGHTHCEDHKTPLIDACPHCGRKQNSKKANTCLSLCNQCERPLYNEQTLTPETGAIYSSDLVSLVYATATLPIEAFPTDGSKKSLEDIYSAHWDSELERELWNHIPRDDCLTYVNSKPITLLVARRLAIMLDIPLVDMLLGHGLDTTRSITHDWPNDSEILFKAQRRTLTELELLRIKTVFKRQVDSAKLGTEAPSLAELAASLGCSTGALEYRFSALCDELLDIRKRQQAHKRLSQFKTAHRKAFKMIEQHPNVGRKKLVRILRKDTAVPVHILRKAIQIQRAEN